MPADVQTNLIEINSDSDPLFGGGAPEPLLRYIADLFRQVKPSHHHYLEKTLLGFVFAGDADRIWAHQDHGKFLKSQIFLTFPL